MPVCRKNLLVVCSINNRIYPQTCCGFNAQRAGNALSAHRLATSTCTFPDDQSTVNLAAAEHWRPARTVRAYADCHGGRSPRCPLTMMLLNDQTSPLMRVPLWVLCFPSGLGLKIDQAVGRGGFVGCLQIGCVAEVVMNDNVLKRLRTGQTATFIIFQTPEEGVVAIEAAPTFFGSRGEPRPESGRRRAARRDP